LQHGLRPRDNCVFRGAA